MPRGAAHSPALDFPPLAWTPTVFGTDQLNRAVTCVQAWRRVSQTRPGPTARAFHRRVRRWMREAGAGLRGPTGRMRLAWLSAERLVSDTRNSVRRPVMRIGGPGLALWPRPRGVIAVRRASTPRPASARPRRPGTGRPPASRALRACRSGRRARPRRGRRSGRLP